jgi:hypothetical protein
MCADPEPIVMSVSFASEGAVAPTDLDAVDCTFLGKTQGGMPGIGLEQSEILVCELLNVRWKPVVEPISKIGDECVARDLALRQGARSENILHGSLTDEQRSRSGKDRQPSGLSSGKWLTALLLSHRTLRLCSFVAPCQPLARA